MSTTFHSGNAAADGHGRAGWFVGHFMDALGDSLAHTRMVEVKWGMHAARAVREQGWKTGETTTTLCVLVSGRFRIALRGDAAGSETQEVLLAEQGDYVMWGPGVDHSWTAVDPSVVLTVRWPSQPA
jgi:hypothetical protein